MDDKKIEGTEEAEKKLRTKLRKKLTPYEWKLLRERLGIKRKLTTFQYEFRKQLATFITGAFAFVAALLWRDAIKSYLGRYQELIQNIMPIKEVWAVELFTAFLVTIVAVIAIVIVSRLLKPQK